MHIVLLILKIIGMILLGILGLIFLLLLILLCSPLGYSATGCYHSDGNKKILGNLHYLFHALKIDVMWDGEKVKFRCKLFAFTLKKGQTETGKKESEEDSDNMDDDFFHEMSISDSISVSGHEGTSGSFDDVLAEDARQDDIFETSDVNTLSSDTEYVDENPVSEPTEPSNSQPLDSQQDQSGSPKPDPFIMESSDDTSSGEEKKSLLDKLNQLIEKVQKGYELITKPSMIRLRNKLIRRIMKILKHVLPRELDVKGEFGLDDPATMGKIMEVYAFLYAFWGDHFELYTDFEREHIDVKGRIKGHLVPIYLVHQVLCMAIALLLQKDVRTFVFGKLFHKEKA